MVLLKWLEYNFLHQHFDTPEAMSFFAINQPILIKESLINEWQTIFVSFALLPVVKVKREDKVGEHGYR